jgi:glycosyltransferase involved in cell wall biosynthesis
LKKIFITIPWFSPAYKAGGPIQSIANMVNVLNEGYQFYIFCGDKDLDGEKLEDIEVGEWIAYNDYTLVWYASDEERSKTLVDEIEKTAPDIVYSIGIFSWHFNLVPLFFCKGPVKILSVRGMLHPGALTQKKIKKQIFLTALKALRIQKKIRFHATDVAEVGFIKAVFGDKIVINEAANFPRMFPKKNKAFKLRDSLKLITVALISPMKNHLLVLEALQQTTLAIQYDIYGPVKDAAYWEQCLAQIAQLPQQVRVVYHGDVQPQFVGTVLEQSEVFILPSKSENYGHAIVEALSSGLPVITSNNTPWNMLEAKGVGINTDLTVSDIMTAIEKFAMMDNEPYQQWSVNASSYASAAIDIDQLKKAYEVLFN